MLMWKKISRQNLYSTKFFVHRKPEGVFCISQLNSDYKDQPNLLFIYYRYKHCFFLWLESNFCTFM